MSLYDKSMGKEARASMEFAEDSRDTEWQHPSYSALLYQGNVKWDLLHPFPQQPIEDKKIGDEFIANFQKFIEEHLDADAVDRTGEIPDDVLKGLADMGCFAMKIPKEYNGLGLSQVNYNRVLHLAGSYCGNLCALLSAHQSIGVPQPLLMFGTDDQKRKYLPRFREGAISAFALTEEDAGSDPRAMTTSATLSEDGSHYVISGEKLWCTNGTKADLIILMAVTAPKVVRGKERKQITAFIVEMNTPGVEVVHRCRFMGLKALYNGVIRFTEVKVPKENMLLGEGDGLRLALQTLNTGRLSIPAACTGNSKWCMKIIRKWSNERVQWGHPIGEHETIAGKQAKIASDTFAMDAVWKLASSMADNKRFDIRLEAAVAKLFNTEAHYAILQETLQIRGGRGFETADSLKARGQEGIPIERALRDSRVNLIFEGSTEIMHLFIAREALDFHLQHIGALFKPGITMGGKVSALLNMTKTYSLWYPKLWLPVLSSGHFGMSPPLNKHMRTVARLSKKMSRVLFHKMAVHQKKMAEKQLLINRFVQIGTELFIMSAACSYAHSLLSSQSDEGAGAPDLADYYCREAQRRIDQLFRDIGSNNDKATVKLNKQFMQGEFEWMEDEIV
ncbi:Acyl-CoA dehydrogenase [Rubripirellula tenax]|uniref:Acyl-CoA dehydrogenase n=1 Tax=Rubripirellula tenax TaxID=2528015 RepID=A0A5C6FL63_9BACT|nr:acyl-CoA dehydrogenase family protein [Rubripirellula tenax]TWU60809.1 Acyl-CoA dehydrogenase [Rubripirellula tenax]